MKTPQQWLDEMKLRPCVTESDLRVIIEQIQRDAIAGISQTIVEAFKDRGKVPTIDQIKMP